MFHFDCPGPPEYLLRMIGKLPSGTRSEQLCESLIQQIFQSRNGSKQQERAAFAVSIATSATFSLDKASRQTTEWNNVHNDIHHIYALRIKNRSESDPRSCEATKAVAKKAQKKSSGFDGMKQQFIQNAQKEGL